MIGSFLGRVLVAVMVDETLDKVLLLPDDRQVVFLEKLLQFTHADSQCLLSQISSNLQICAYLELWSVVCFVKHVMLM